ncbi:hypothetical protein GCM10011614_33510 [Novosphingobium colocasiae]|uniref:Uncharacterized protein n=1 Tax=Novosphingobium colocasiae TaxID=1256513 RepID=A0A918PNB8_9SPHN|nr:hypothetical protein GCM10011614_33510 [Novosphingobium colocasiae]
MRHQVSLSLDRREIIFDDGVHGHEVTANLRSPVTYKDFPASEPIDQAITSQNIPRIRIDDDLINFIN